MRQVAGRALWLGNPSDTRDARTVLEAGIEAVVELADNEPLAFLPRELIRCRFPLSDGGEARCMNLSVGSLSRIPAEGCLWASNGFVMQSLMRLGCLLAATSLSVGCTCTEPMPPTVTAAAPVTKTTESDVVLARRDTLSEQPRVRLHLTMLLLEMQVPTEGLQPFSAELPDLFGTDEACRVVGTDELWAVITKLQQQQVARHPPKQIVDVASASAGIWRTEWPHDHHDGTVTPTVEADGVVRVELIPPSRKGNSALTTATAIESLRANETLVVSEPAEKSGVVKVSSVPVLGDIPVVGDELFTSRGKPRHYNTKKMYLVSYEAVTDAIRPR